MGGGPFRPDNGLAGPRSVKRWLAHPLTRDVRLDERIMANIAQRDMNGASARSNAARSRLTRVLP